MSNYNVVSLNGGNLYDLNGVHFDGKSFMYWRNKSSQIDREVMVIFNRDDGNITLRDGVVVLCLDKLHNYQDIKNAIEIFRMQIVKNQNIFIQFVVGNDEEKKVVDELGRDFQFSYNIKDMRKNTKIQKVEEELKSGELSAKGSQTINTESNGISKKVMVNDGKAYLDNSILGINKEKEILLNEWEKDPLMMRKIENLSEEELDRLLMEYVTRNQKSYRMESSIGQNAHDKVGEVALGQAGKEDGLVNTELGIVQNHVSHSNLFSAVEERGNHVEVVTPNVVSSSIGAGATSSISTGSRSGEIYQESDSVHEKQEQERRVDAVFYIDEEYNLYNQEGKLIGKVGQNGYMPNYEDNTIVRDGQVIGYIGDIKEMGSSKGNIYTKPKTLTYKKSESRLSNDRAAFVSLPVIIFVISGLLLIVSIVFLFVLD